MAIPIVASFMRKRSRIAQAFVKVVEVMLLSTGLISTLLMLKGALFMPYPRELVFASLLGFWKSFVNSILSSPLCICIIIYSMILLIKFSSTFHDRVQPYNREHEANIQSRVVLPPPSPSPSSPPLQPHPPCEATASPEDISTKVVSTPEDISPKVVTTKGSPEDITTKGLQETSHADSPNILHGNININQDGFEKPKKVLRPQALDIKKTISLRNPIPNSQEPLSVKRETKTYPSKRGMTISIEKDDVVTNDEEGDSMEATWKAIMGGGKQKTKKRPLKKSETWDVPTRPSNEPIKRLDSEVVVPSSPIWREMRKAETFNDAMSMRRRGGLIRRDSSMSLEDFNTKIDGFIKKLKWKSKASGSNAR